MTRTEEEEIVDKLKFEESLRQIKRIERLRQALKVIRAGYGKLDEVAREALRVDDKV